MVNIIIYNIQYWGYFIFSSLQDSQYITVYQDQHLNRELLEPEVLQLENVETVLSYNLHKTRELWIYCI